MGDRRIREMIVSMKMLKAYWINLAVQLIIFPVYIIVMYFLWSMVSANSSNFPMALPALITYYALAFVASQNNQGDITYRFTKHVRWGDLAIFLVRPFHYLKVQFWWQLPRYLFFYGIFAGLLFVISKFFDLAVSSDPRFVLMFAFVSFLGFLMSFLMYFSVGCISFWVENNWGITRSFQHLTHFFSGTLIPLEFFGGLFGAIALLTPFRFMVHFPVQIIMGQLTWMEILPLLGMQIAWIVVLYLIAMGLWKIGVKKFKGYGI